MLGDGDYFLHTGNFDEAFQADLQGMRAELAADLDRLNQLDDGVMSFIDAGQLLQLRLADAGIEVTLDEYPGGHTTLNKLAELVRYLKAASTP